MARPATACWGHAPSATEMDSLMTINMYKSEMADVGVAQLRRDLTAEDEALAGDLADEHDLSGVDAVHLACALVIGAAASVVLATWDQRLAEAAKEEGLATLPA